MARNGSKTMTKNRQGREAKDSSKDYCFSRDALALLGTKSQDGIKGYRKG